MIYEESDIRRAIVAAQKAILKQMRAHPDFSGCTYDIEKLDPETLYPLAVIEARNVTAS